MSSTEYSVCTFCVMSVLRSFAVRLRPVPKATIMPPTETVLALLPVPSVMRRSLARTMGGAVIGCTWLRVLPSATGPSVVNSGLLSPKATFQSSVLALVRSNFHRLPRLSPA
ncbi:hypothetical protein D3C78_1340010 [compost metagenome]